MRWTVLLSILVGLLAEYLPVDVVTRFYIFILAFVVMCVGLIVVIIKRWKEYSN